VQDEKAYAPMLLKDSGNVTAFRCFAREKAKSPIDSRPSEKVISSSWVQL